MQTLLLILLGSGCCGCVLEEGKSSYVTEGALSPISPALLSSVCPQTQRVKCQMKRHADHETWDFSEEAPLSFCLLAFWLFGPQDQALGNPIAAFGKGRLA